MAAPRTQRQPSLVSLHFGAGSEKAGVSTTADVLTSRIHVHARGKRVTIAAGPRAKLTLPLALARELRDELTARLG